MKKRVTKTRPTTHICLGLFIGTGIDQQPHTVRVTPRIGTHQRRVSVLQDGVTAAHSMRSFEIKEVTKKQIGENTFEICEDIG